MQKGVGGVMGGALIETEARRLRDEATAEKARKTALRMLKSGEYSELSVEEVKQLEAQLAEPQTV